MNTQETLRRVLDRSRADPEWFFTHVLGDAPWGGGENPGQIEIIRSVHANKRTAVKSCNGAGKTWLAARLALWGLVTHYNARVITTAPTARQVEGLLWSEISTAWRKVNERWPGLLPGHLYEIPRLQISKSWYAMGFSTNDPNALQGIHAPYVLIILDEAGGNKGGVAAPMWEPIDGNLVGENCHLLAIGNPTDPTSPFFLECQNPATTTLTISAFATPNFTTYGITEEDIISGAWEAKQTGPLPNPELTTPAAVAGYLAKYGRQSTYWQARVLGEFPQQGTDALLWMRWVDAAMERWGVDPGDVLPTRIALGVDVAAGGENETVIAGFAWYGEGSIPRQTMLRASTMADTTRTRDLVLAACLDAHVTAPDAPVSVHIDADGLGRGVADMVSEQAHKRGWHWLEVVHMRSGMRAPDHEMYANNRAFWWWSLRERFEQDRIALMTDDLQTSQLTSIKYHETSANRRLQIETKEEAERRGVVSPDRADAVMFALAPVHHAAGLFPRSTAPTTVSRTSSSFTHRLARSKQRSSLL